MRNDDDDDDDDADVDDDDGDDDNDYGDDDDDDGDEDDDEDMTLGFVCMVACVFGLLRVYCTLYKWVLIFRFATVYTI